MFLKSDRSLGVMCLHGKFSEEMFACVRALVGGGGPVGPVGGGGRRPPRGAPPRRGRRRRGPRRAAGHAPGPRGPGGAPGLLRRRRGADEPLGGHNCVLQACLGSLQSAFELFFVRYRCFVIFLIGDFVRKDFFSGTQVNYWV